MPQNKMEVRILRRFSQMCHRPVKSIDAICVSNLYRTLNSDEKELFENVMKDFVDRGIFYLGKRGITDCMLLTEKGAYLLKHRNDSEQPDHAREDISYNTNTTPAQQEGKDENKSLGLKGNL